MSIIVNATKLIVVFMLLASVAFIIFAVTLDENDLDFGPGHTPGLPRPASKKPYNTVVPVVKPQQRPPYKRYLSEAYNLRQCECLLDWASLPSGTPDVCRCRGICPSHVTPVWLTEAAGQALCSLREETGFNCYAECINESEDVKWFAHPCGAGADKCDPPILKAQGQAAIAPPPQPPPTPVEVEQPATTKLGWDPKEVYDLRGLQCELLEGKERCYLEDAQGRELCPDYVTPEWLAFPKDQFLCSAEMATQYYCTVGCQEGNEEVRWGANEIKWCNEQGASACPPRPAVYPKAGFKLQPWSEPKVPEPMCAQAWKRGERTPTVPNLSFGMLTHEPRSMRDTLETYERLGLFDVAQEFLIYINKRRPEVDDVLAPYLTKYGSKIKVMGDANNYGIARGIMFLTGNASNEYFLFLERDFQLIEPAPCIFEQLTAGIKMVEGGTADVVRYRHRHKPGRPNWAEKMFRGHEDDVFKGGQPNLFCNHYYWVPEPEKRWPDKMWICNKDPVFHCSDSYYCNWTNNPQLWKISWWNKEYVQQFDNFKRNDPYYDLESYMNWEPNSWNDRHFTVAQGMGLFKHVDRGNFGA